MSRREGSVGMIGGEEVLFNDGNELNHECIEHPIRQWPCLFLSFSFFSLVRKNQKSTQHVSSSFWLRMESNAGDTTLLSYFDAYSNATLKDRIISGNEIPRGRDDFMEWVEMCGK